MIKLITGKKGTGKTKVLIDMINDAVKSTNGDLICIEKGAKLTYDISYKVRLVDAERFQVTIHSMVLLPECSQEITISRKSLLIQFLKSAVLILMNSALCLISWTSLQAMTHRLFSQFQLIMKNCLQVLQNLPINKKSIDNKRRFVYNRICDACKGVNL